MTGHCWGLWEQGFVLVGTAGSLCVIQRSQSQEATSVASGARGTDPHISPAWHSLGFASPWPSPWARQLSPEQWGTGLSLQNSHQHEHRAALVTPALPLSPLCSPHAHQRAALPGRGVKTPPREEHSPLQSLPTSS